MGVVDVVVVDLVLLVGMLVLERVRVELELEPGLVVEDDEDDDEVVGFVVVEWVIVVVTTDD